jgi:transcriptional regulator with XRE-family HTH domain
MNATELNRKIVKRIKDARIEGGKTQKELADTLNKTSAAISDMEREKVQVSAGELYLIAKMLDRPIEYFFGEDFGGKDLQDIIAVTRAQDNETRSSTMEVAKMMMKLYAIQKKVIRYKKGEDVPNELVQDFYETFIPFSKTINGMAKKFNDVEEFLNAEIRTRGIKPSLKK